MATQTSTFFFFPIGFVRQIVRKALIRLWRFARSVTPRLNKFPRGATLAGKTVVAKQETLDWALLSKLALNSDQVKKMDLVITIAADLCS